MAETAKPAESIADQVTVILSTFNGSAFLEEQLESLYGQVYPNVRIVVRDDGSSDTTRVILAREHAGGRIELLPGHDNLGAARSFFQLLQTVARTGAAYVAFCDQDDVWQPEKISSAVAALSAIRNERPALYASRLEIVDAALTRVGFTPLPRRTGFGNALVESVCVGCTMVLNRKAVDLISENLPARVLVHDWWCYLVLACFGEIVFDPEARIKYRQHGDNVFGAPANKLERLGKILRRFGGRGDGRHWQSEQASMFLETFGDRVPESFRRVLDDFVAARVSPGRRLKLSVSRLIWRQKTLDNIALRLLVLANRF